MGAFIRQLLFVAVISWSVDPTALESEQVPKFTTQFPTNYDFANETGGKLICKPFDDSNTKTSWILSDGSPVTNVGRQRRVMPDGSLVFPPFGAEDYRQDVHGVSYRCSATNALGTVVSNEIKVRGVVAQTFDVHVYDAYASRGNTAVLRCHIPKFLQPYVSVTAWIKDSVVSITSANLDAKSKYSLLPTGELVVKDVDPNDADTTYKCRVTHKLLGETKTSVNPGRLIVTESAGNVPPKIIYSNSHVTVIKDEEIFLPCIANSQPVSTYSWTKQTASENLSTIKPTKRIRLASGSLIIANARVLDGGIYSCSASNGISSDKITTVVTVVEPLAVSVTPPAITVDANRAVSLSCKVNGSPIVTITWLKDGKSLPNGVTLTNNETIHITRMQAAFAGIYQCFARNNFFSSNGVAVVKLGDTLPIILSGFDEQILEPGDTIRVQCSARGNPVPQFHWTLDNVNISHYERTKTNMRSTGEDEISGTLTISNARVEDGGLYRCVSANKAGIAESTARINVKGKLSVRINIKFRVAGQENAQIDCPVYGYPIKTIKWMKNGRTLPLHLRHTIHENGSLIIRNVQRSSDNGKYKCVVSGNDGEMADGIVELLVMVTPKITPFSFQDDLIQEGARARVTCVVSEGQSPLTISWFKDDQPLLQGQGINFREIDEFSSILMISSISPRHNGNYTCVATNVAGSNRHTASLFVNVVPKITPFSFRKDIFEDNLVRISCIVYQGDLPINIKWLKNGEPLDHDETIITRKIDDYSSILTIESAQLQHSANYTCVASNAASSTSYTDQLIVYVPPRWIKKPQDAIIRSGNNFVLNCEADGFPKPSITWVKLLDSYNIAENGELVANDEHISVYENGTLLFTNIQRINEGLYTCVASNDIGEPISHVVSIKVQAAPIFEKIKDEIFAKRGDEVKIECEANGNWPISYTWTDKNNKKIDDEGNTRYKIEESQSESSGRSVSTLTISWVDRKDSITFFCNAKNEIGESQARIKLTVRENPEPPIIEIPIKVLNQTVELSWKMTFDGNGEITKFFIQYKKEVDRWNDKTETITVLGSNRFKQIANLKPAILYEFRVMAENIIGNSTFSDVVSVKTEETAPEGAPENVDVESMDANTLRVMWKPPKKSLWNGAIRGYNIGFKIYGTPDEYTFNKLEVPDDYTDELIYQLVDLQMYTQYNVIVRAYNSKGNGPRSEPVLAMTSEDVPSKSPGEVRCSTLSSKSIYALWQPPASESINGILRGYKIFYKAAEEWYDAMLQTQISPDTKITLNNLEANTNYTIQISAFTKVGDGIKSVPVYCKTHEDVPESPESIKVLPSSSNSVVVAWKPPQRTSGALTKYTVYYKPIEDGQTMDTDAQKTQEFQRDAKSRQSQANERFTELSGLDKNKKYAFWVTATSAIGESKGSTVVAQTVADSIVAAKSASFDNVIKTPWKEDVILPCVAVGVPTPNRKWTVGGKTINENNRVKLTTDGSIIITKATSEDSGNYSCAVYNAHGRDEVNYALTVQVPPSAPTLEVVAKSRTSIKLQWKSVLSGGESLKGYLLHHKRDNGLWVSQEIRPDQTLFTLDKLSCGTTYQIYVEAFNNIGTGAPSDTLTVSTDGGDVITPTKEEILREGTTFVTVNLDAWPSNACPVKNFAAEYKSFTAREWTKVGDNIRPTQKKLIVSELLPATWYILRLKVESSSTPIMAEYRFATHTTAGGTVAPDSFEKSRSPVYIFYLDPLIFIPAVALLIVVIIASLVICFYFKRRNGSVGSPSDYSDVGTHLNTWPRNGPKSPFDHSTMHSTLSRCNKDPSPYATSQVAEFYQPQHGIPHQFTHDSFPASIHGNFQQSAVRFSPPAMRSDGQFASQRCDDAYDPPPMSHMMRHSIPRDEYAD